MGFNLHPLSDRTDDKCNMCLKFSCNAFTVIIGILLPPDWTSFWYKAIITMELISELSFALKHSGRHMALSRLVTLSVSSLRNLDIEANKFYDRAHRLYDAAILTRCYTQHALQPYIDSEIIHIRHFIKIQFVNKGIGFINLPSIFKDKSVISSIPTYFEIRNPLSFVISIINLFIVLFLIKQISNRT